MAQFKADNLFSIPGRTAVITGGGSGLGRICAKTFVANGASVTIIDLEPSHLSSVKEELSQIKPSLSLPSYCQIHIIQSGLSSKSSLESITPQLQTLHKITGIDILVHYAGIRHQNKLAYKTGESLMRLAEATASLDYADLEASF
ncbi:hypothetical protein BDV12DRAFT_192145 [Aspergillus spectabilis]